MKTLKEIRNEKDVTQEQVARAVDITAKQYYNIEKGVSIPKVKIALKICRYLGADINTVSDWQP
ncbi:helix-turn-helix transcriptional regulator [Brevibacillus sp. DP1.3A]|uniref:helix-turn-helix transcriptional regulator n=1 Tax=Brevibacillus sp. DP1.3A TaxID=2738867 RepID=UPI00156AD13E|nr:helix-turn-helix domain-containing protein [Brevibacillus sp. DP1.3A]UED78126.1 helix-turn-helix domain-containing protein [Brevibacillus sp. DP1.3A]